MSEQITGEAVASVLGIEVATELSPTEDVRVRAFGLDEPRFVVKESASLGWGVYDVEWSMFYPFVGREAAEDAAEVFESGAADPERYRGELMITVDERPSAEVWKERSLALLRLQEQASRAEVVRIRAAYDEGGATAPAMAEVIRQEARAGAFASAVEIVEGVPL